MFENESGKIISQIRENQENKIEIEKFKSVAETVLEVVQARVEKIIL